MKIKKLSVYIVIQITSCRDEIESTKIHGVYSSRENAWRASVRLECNTLKNNPTHWHKTVHVIHKKVKDYGIDLFSGYYLISE